MYSLVKSSKVAVYEETANPYLNYPYYLGLDYIKIDLYRRCMAKKGEPVELSEEVLVPLLSEALSMPIEMVLNYSNRDAEKSMKSLDNRIFYNKWKGETHKGTGLAWHYLSLQVPGPLADMFARAMLENRLIFDSTLFIKFKRIDLKVKSFLDEEDYKLLGDAFELEHKGLKEYYNKKKQGRNVSLSETEKGIVLYVGAKESSNSFKMYIRKEKDIVTEEGFYVGGILNQKGDQCFNERGKVFHMEQQLLGKRAESIGTAIKLRDWEKMLDCVCSEQLNWGEVLEGMREEESVILNSTYQHLQKYYLITKNVEYNLRLIKEIKITEKVSIIKKEEYRNWYNKEEFPYPPLVKSLLKTEEIGDFSKSKLPKGFYMFWATFLEYLLKSSKKELPFEAYLEYAKKMENLTGKSKPTEIYTLEIEVNGFLKDCKVKDSKANREALSKFMDFMYNFDFSYSFLEKDVLFERKTRLCSTLDKELNNYGRVKSYKLKINSSIFIEIFKSRFFLKSKNWYYLNLFLEKKMGKVANYKLLGTLFYTYYTSYTSYCFS